MKEKRLYNIAMVGAVICFIGDILLGLFTPALEFGNKIVGISFSYEWADVEPVRFVIAGFLGSVALLLMFSGFYGIYLRMKDRNDGLSSLFLLSAFVFVSVGTLYHNVFAVTAYTYNKLMACGFDQAQDISMDIFNTFILVSIPAAIGYACMTVVFFISCLKGNIYPKRWMCFINPLVCMLICVALSKILPQTPFVNGIFSMGQQSIGLFIVFMTLFVTSKGIKAHGKTRMNI
ncbi:MAG: hypothetical protein IJ079_11435 [Lachnospiraceae bacterium]|nr:hypothetical protein [Lachnospiraceae bacterium]